jgi:hypothetical protein
MLTVSPDSANLLRENGKNEKKSVKKTDFSVHFSHKSSNSFRQKYRQIASQMTGKNKNKSPIPNLNTLNTPF